MLLNERKLINTLKKLIKEALKSTDFQNFRISPKDKGSHPMYKGSRDGKEYFIKFPGTGRFTNDGPILNALNEYLFFKLYELYANAGPENKQYFRQPSDVQLVMMNNNRGGVNLGIGSVTATVTDEFGGGGGYQSVGYKIKEYVNEIWHDAGLHVGSRYYVDSLFANWDQPKNMIYDIEKNKATNKYKLKGVTGIDPGGSGFYRARGERKEPSQFADSTDVTELDQFGRMPSRDIRDGAGGTYLYPFRNDSLSQRIFFSVSKEDIINKISEVCNEVSQDLIDNSLADFEDNLLENFQNDCERLKEILPRRYDIIANRIKTGNIPRTEKTSKNQF